jgi:DNA repair exonuclease SbcCD ATPase subunit
MFKGGLVGLGLASAALFWVFGGRAWDLVSSKAERARQTVRDMTVSFDDEISLARKQVEKLTPAIHEGANAQAKLEDSVAEVKSELARLESDSAHRAKRIERLRAGLDDQPTIHRVAGSVADNPSRIEIDLAREIDSFKQVQRTIAYTEDTLKYREAAVQTFSDRLKEMKAAKKTLESKIDEIEARNKARVASRQFNEYRIDTSPLAEAQKAVAELDRKENVSARAEELQTELSDPPVSDEVYETSGRDVRGEADEILKGGSASYAPVTTTANRAA